jgi:hypothetical protein
MSETIFTMALTTGWVCLAICAVAWTPLAVVEAALKARDLWQDWKAGRAPRNG